MIRTYGTMGELRPLCYTARRDGALYKIERQDRDGDDVIELQTSISQIANRDNDEKIVVWTLEEAED